MSTGEYDPRRNGQTTTTGGGPEPAHGTCTAPCCYPHKPYFAAGATGGFGLHITTGFGALADPLLSGAETTPQREKSASDAPSGKAEGDVGTIHDRKQYGGGATRSGDTDNYAFDLIPSCASRREARRWRQGERGHGRGNWQRGQPIAVQVRHLLAHANAYLAALERGDALAESARDDHLAAIRCNAAMLMWYEEAHPEMFTEGTWQEDVG